MARGKRIKLPPTKEVETIIRGDALESARLTNQWGDSIGTALSKSLKAAQIRNIFGKVRQLERRWVFHQEGIAPRREMILLVPKLRFQAQRKQEVEDLAEVLIEAIQIVDDSGDRHNPREKFQRFVDFFEAILAYHKAGEGR
jgi:CRISPR-associated protein Csm2